MAMVESDYQVARTHLEQGAAIARQIGDSLVLTASLRELKLVDLYQGDLAAAERHCAECLAAGRAAGSDWDLALALFNLGSIASTLNDSPRAVAAYEECLSLFTKVHDEWGVALVLGGLGYIASQQGDYATARAQLEASCTLLRSHSDNWSLGDLLTLLGEVVHREGDLAKAAELYAEGLRLSRVVGDKMRTSLQVHHCGALAHVWGEDIAAARLFGAAGAMRSAANGVDWFTITSSDDYDREVDAVRNALGEAAFAVHWAEGQALIFTQAIDLALNSVASWSTSAPTAFTQIPALPNQGRPQPAPAVGLGDLSAREVEVLRLLAQGLSNADIAGRLTLSPHTVNHHLTSIYTKLNVSSRHAASRYAYEHHLV